MIKEHKLNIEQSKEVLESCRPHIERKQCYNNVFNVLTFYGGMNFYHGKWKIAYGCVKAVDGIMARHAFILNEHDEVIDPTIVGSHIFNEEKEHLYISFKVFESIDEYLETLERNDRQPALYGAFREREKMASDWALERGMFFTG